MDFQSFLNGLEEQLRKLPYAHQLAFAASCCERAFPNYVAFSTQERWGDAAVLRSVLDAVWDFLLINRAIEDEIPSLRRRCESVTPKSDDFEPKTAISAASITAGQEAALMVTLLLEFCRDKQTSYAVRVATFARDTIDAYVQARDEIAASDPQLEEKVVHHQLMRTELERQRSDLALLTKVRESGLVTFAKNVRAFKVSNIGLTTSPP
jgi:uncharacterized protein YjaG (DUF416 family)